MSCIHYKFRSSLEYDTVTFDGLGISLADLKKAIMAQKKFGKTTDFDLEITNAQTKEVYKDESVQIPKNSSVIIRRIPTGTRSKSQLAAEKADPSAGGLPKTKSDLQDLQDTSKKNKMVDLVNSDASEDDKLKAMMNQAGEDWQPTNYVRGRGRGMMSGPLPPNYVCYRCNQPGHFIRNCPKNGMKQVIGIPKTFVENAIRSSSPSQDESKKSKKEDGPKTLVPAADVPAAKADRKVPSELRCPMCKNLLTDTVLIPCCGTSYCDECIRTYLLENEQECPTCGAESVSPDSLIINKQLRQAVNNFRNVRPASPFMPEIDSPGQTAQNKQVPDSGPGEKKASDSVKKEIEEPPSEPQETPRNGAEPKDSTPEPSKIITSPRSDHETGSPSAHRDRQLGLPLPGNTSHMTHSRPGEPHPVDPSHPHGVPPQGALHVPPVRPPHSLPGPVLMAQPGLMSVSLGIRPMASQPVMAHPIMHMEPIIRVPGPFAMGMPGFPGFNGPGRIGPGEGFGPPPLSEEEFYRYQRKMKMKHKKKEVLKSRGKERDPLRHPSRDSSRERTKHGDGPTNFDDELSEYRALQRSRQHKPSSRNTSRSRSPVRSRSPIHPRSWSRSVSHSLSHSSASRSPTPEDWDRSRTPSRSPTPDSRSQTSNGDKSRKHRKRKKTHKHKHAKKSKTEEQTDDGKTDKKKSKKKSKDKSKNKGEKSKNKEEESKNKEEKSKNKEEESKNKEEESKNKEEKRAKKKGKVADAGQPSEERSVGDENKAGNKNENQDTKPLTEPETIDQPSTGETKKHKKRKHKKKHKRRKSKDGGKFKAGESTADSHEDSGKEQEEGDTDSKQANPVKS